MNFRCCITVTVIIYFRDGNTEMKKLPVPLTPAVFHVLLALADGPLHGYGIMQAVEASAANEPPMGPGTIYGSLQRMEEAGLVKEVAARTDDRRRVFTLLPAGRRALAQEAERLARLAALVREKRLIPDEA
jgi:DNA-binding PadR family transcriptional regulator